MTTLTFNNSIRQQYLQNDKKKLVFYQTLSVQVKINIKYLQFSRLDLNHYIHNHLSFIFMPKSTHRLLKFYL